MAFQGNFPLRTAPDLGLAAGMLTSDGIEFFGQLSFLKAGIRYADRLTTVSPTYAREILTTKYGCGLDGLLNARKADLVGILNGVDYRVWDPAVDSAIISRYTADDISGKAACKAAVQTELGLLRSDVPLVIFVNRITHQKMADIVFEALPALLQEGAQFVLHGRGDKSLENAFAAAARINPGRMAAMRDAPRLRMGTIGATLYGSLPGAPHCHAHQGVREFVCAKRCLARCTARHLE